MLPPFVGVAVKVIVLPAQAAPAGLAAMLTLTGRFGLTDIVTVFDAAGEPVAQVALDVNVHVTTSLSFNVAGVYVAELVPTLPPFSFH